MITVLRKRIMDILASKGWSVQYFADLVEEQYEDISAYTVENICRGKTPDPRVSTLLAMSNVLGHSINCLMGQCQHTTKEKILLREYRSCSVHGKNRIEMIARYEAATGDKVDAFRGREIPCSVPPQVDVQKGIMYDSCDTIYIWTTIDEAELAIQMVGNELSPLYCKGDQLLFANRFPVNGEHGAFIIDGKVYIRKYIEEKGQYILKSLRGEGKDIVVKRMDEVHYLGTCCGVIRA